MEDQSKKQNKNSESGFSHQLYTFNVLQADSPADDLAESPALIRTGSEAYAHNIQNPNPANDEKIQNMMGFLNEDDKETDSLFGLTDQLTRKKSNTVGHVKRPQKVDTRCS